MHYYSERKTVENGVPKTTTTYKTGERNAMERQFCLFRASAATNEDNHDMDVCEWGTLEQGVIERKVYRKTESEEPTNAE